MNSENLTVYEGKKKKTNGSGTKLCKPIETDDLTAILDMTIETSIARSGRTAVYPNTTAGLDDFIQTTIDYFSYVNAVNTNPDLERKLIPDIESWAVYCGVTRQTIWGYQKRGKEWREVIEFYKGAIMAAKKQLALNYKIPPAVFIFDACNNSDGYANTNEFKLTEVRTETETEQNKVDKDIKAAGLVWDEELQILVPMEESAKWQG